MKVFVLIMSDREMRPRSDIVTTVIFFSHEAALSAMNRDISTAMENGDVERDGIERFPDYAASSDGRFFWKIEERIVNGAERAGDAGLAPASSGCGEMTMEVHG